MGKTRNVPDVKTQFTLSIKQHIKNQEWDRLADVIQSAEQADVATSLRKKAWLYVGMHREGQGNHPAAILAFNSARSLDLGDEIILGDLLRCYDGLYSHFEAVFSREDLLLLKEPLERLSNFYTLHNRSSEQNTTRMKDLVVKIKGRIKYSVEREETPASHHVLAVFNALYPNTMTPEEIRIEFARIIAPVIRTHYDELKKEGSRTKKKRRPEKRTAPPRKPPHDDGDVPKNEDPPPGKKK